jgi:NAD(P)-dependent dehydrogenase (short-subunit alcohol dehydrogenase family)
VDLQLSDKTVLVTGASKGMGAAIARAFSRDGANVVHIVARSADDLAKVQGELETNATTVHAHALDLSDQRARDRLAAEVPDVDILINNAGAIPRGTIEDLPDDVWRQSWELKVWGYIDLTRKYIIRMKERGDGVIINNIGAGGERPNYRYVAGAMANAGLMAMTRAIGGESMNFGVRVLGVNTGFVETPRFVAALRERATQQLGAPEDWPQLLKDEPAGRAATPEEIADAVVFLASPRSSFTSGTIVTIDGGMVSRPVRY